ncbi:coiled-coil domain-containing protein 89-like [Camellia sinensis]|uniref:coiled-coil domain-containing protein 89-like n=1 Tax=Camellia sinensis TaxID=4442 RepID=UPI001035EED4|nr:coiled-coil domain-containing protein 89-like [Camellia sinensis]
METPTLDAALLGKAKVEVEPLKGELEKARAQVQNLRRKVASWRKVARSACAKGLAYAQRAKKMEVLAVVQGYLTKHSRMSQGEVASELSTPKSELEVVHRVISLEFELASEHKRTDEAQQAYAIAKERLEEALMNNEDLHDSAVKDKEDADVRIADLERALEEEKGKTAELARMMESEKAAYPDLCTAAMEQFKLSSEFQMSMDAAMVKSLAREGDGGAGPSNLATAKLVEGKTKEEIIQRFQQLDYYKHEMSLY